MKYFLWEAERTPSGFVLQGFGKEDGEWGENECL